MVALAAILLIPVPGSLSVVVTRALSSLHLPSSLASVVADGGLVVLAATTSLAVAVAWMRGTEDRVVLASGAAAVAGALGVSEVLKALVGQERPCQAWMTGGPGCPPVGDWSFPSNHAALAFAALVVLAAVSRSGWVTGSALVVAALVAASRVLGGVHYLHDVAVGAILGLTLPTICMIATAWLRREASGRTPGPHPATRARSTR
jgi:undecaprenyl-diphosphatase